MAAGERIARPPINEETSLAIRTARVICIFLLTFAHAINLQIEGAATGDSLYWAARMVEGMRDIAGRCSVPLLSVVSGWLFVTTYKGSARRTLVSKMRVLVIPLFLWNVVFAVVLVAAYLAGTDYNWPIADNLHGLADQFLAFSAFPLDVPLYFLRDLFICAAFGSLILLADRHAGRWAAGIVYPAALAGSILLAIVFTQSIVMQKSVILPSFILGMMIARLRIDVLSPRLIPPAALIGAIVFVLGYYLLLATPVLSGRSDALQHTLELVDRLCLAVICWSIVRPLARASAGQWLSSWEKFVFFIFCSHFILFMVIEAILKRVGGPFDSWGHIAVYFAEPVIAFTLGRAAFRFLNMTAPALLGRLVGGRGVKRGAEPGTPFQWQRWRGTLRASEPDETDKPVASFPGGRA